MARNRTAVAVAISAGVVAAVGCCIAGAFLLVLQNPPPGQTLGADSPRTTAEVGATDQPAAEQPADTPPAGVGQPVRDGRFEFVVTSVECGATRIGGDYLYQDAQGQYCLVRLSVTNIGDRPQMFTASNQYAYNAAGQRYDADGAAGLYLDEADRAFLEDINPGNSVDAVLVFDIPLDAAIATLELHDSLFSGGVTVTLQ